MSLQNQDKSQTVKQPRDVIDNIYAFAPNRDTLGGTAYLIVRNEGNILVDCPAWDEINQNFITAHGGVRWLFITHRTAIAQTTQLKLAFNCEVIIQEQEAYLLPGVELTTFNQELSLGSKLQLIWTPGHSPGSSCLYYSDFGGILFSGRHILPDGSGKPMPLRTAKTFHWKRQIKSLELLIKRFSPETLRYLCPGANTGFMRGKRIIDDAYNQIFL
jgi:glyoxylase-like metal-dependent hydrolase (beta-lactamase superfamily II)